MFKKIITVIFLALFLFSCDYSPLYSNKNLKKINLDVLKIEGDKELNKYIMSDLNKYFNRDGKEVKLSVITNYSKNIASRDTKGSISNREFATFEGWSASIDKTAEGNLKILEVTRRIAQRELDVARYTKKLLSEDPVYTQSIQGTFKLQEKVEEYIEKLASDPKTNIYGVTDMSFEPVTTTVPDGVGAYIGD